MLLGDGDKVLTARVTVFRHTLYKFSYIITEKQQKSNGGYRNGNPFFKIFALWGGIHGKGKCRQIKHKTYLSAPKSLPCDKGRCQRQLTEGSKTFLLLVGIWWLPNVSDPSVALRRQLPLAQGSLICYQPPSERCCVLILPSYFLFGKIFVYF